jgi:phosphoserine/homoserine phosphotransferase
LHIACLDLEGVLIPEIWVGLADRAGIPELRATTRDVPDYDQLMTQRLRLLDEHKLGLPDIQAVISQMHPLAGAREFLDWLRERCQIVILSDTFYEFASPLMRQLGHPALLCHRLSVDNHGRVTAYHIRQKDPKRHAVKAFRALNYRIIAAGDSYNDTSMLSEADAGIFYRPPANVVSEFPQFPVTQTYDELRKAFTEAIIRLGETPRYV